MKNLKKILFYFAVIAIGFLAYGNMLDSALALSVYAALEWFHLFKNSKNGTFITAYSVFLVFVYLYTPSYLDALFFAMVGLVHFENK